MAKTALSDGTQAILDDFANRRGLSRRAMAEMHKSLTEGSSNWVDALSTGSASQRQLHTSPGKVGVPRPTRPGKFYQPPQPQKRLQHSISNLTSNYERDQYQRTQLIHDACAQRKEDQLLFEYGKEGLRGMRRLQAEQEAAVTARGNSVEDDCSGVRDALVEQIFKEIEERLQFQQDMEGVRGAQESCQTVRIEVARRISELARLGLDVSTARTSACPGQRILPKGQ